MLYFIGPFRGQLPIARYRTQSRGAGAARQVQTVG